MTHLSTYDRALALPTNALWQATHDSLCAGKWSAARAYLDALGQRGDVVDRLMDLDAYTRAAGEQGGNDLSSHTAWQIRTLLTDRIDQVNWRVDARAADPTAGY